MLSCKLLPPILLHVLTTPLSPLTFIFYHILLSSSRQFISKFILFKKKSKTFIGVKKERKKEQLNEEKKGKKGKERESMFSKHDKQTNAYLIRYHT